MVTTRFLRHVLSGILLALIGSNASAALITYIHAGSGSGSIGTNSFANADFVITATADTGNRELFSNGFSIDHAVASISISGMGTFSFLTDTRTFVNNAFQTVGFSRATTAGTDLFNGPTNAAFASWGADTSIGPISGSGTLIQWNLGDIATTGGILIFTGDTTSATFQATVVPLPAAAWLLGSGLLGLFAIARRKQPAPLASTFH